MENYQRQGLVGRDGRRGWRTKSSRRWKILISYIDEMSGPAQRNSVHQATTMVSFYNEITLAQTEMRLNTVAICDKTLITPAHSIANV